jgi:hypothetical protein
MRKRQADETNRGNRSAAEIILGDPDTHAGLPQLWAELWRTRHASEAKAAHENEEGRRQGRLFKRGENTTIWTQRE